MPNAPVRHHTVPKFYLSGFAKRTRLRAVDVATSNSFMTSVSDATIENHFYSLPSHPTNPSVFEEKLARIESNSAGILGKAARGEWPLNNHDRLLFAEFMTLQHLRGQDHRRQMHSALEAILRQLAVEDPTEFERVSNLPGAPAGLKDRQGDFPPLATSASHVQQIEVLLLRLQPFFLERSWTLVQFDAASLLTSDAPITPVPRNDGNQSDALGLQNSRAMLFPLSRDAGLIMQSLSPLHLVPGVMEDVAAGRLDLVMPGDESSRLMFNANTAMHAHKRIYHHPDDAHLVPEDLPELAARGGRIDLADPPAGLHLEI